MVYRRGGEVKSCHLKTCKESNSHEIESGNRNQDRNPPAPGVSPPFFIHPCHSRVWNCQRWLLSICFSVNLFEFVFFFALLVSLDLMLEPTSTLLLFHSVGTSQAPPFVRKWHKTIRPRKQLWLFSVLTFTMTFTSGFSLNTLNFLLWVEDWVNCVLVRVWN